MNESVKIVVDCGSSLIKSIAQVGDSPPIFLDMPSYCARTTEEKCLNLSKHYAEGLSIKSSWVSDVDGYYLLGDHARHYASAEIGLLERKNSRAIYQTLGMVGAFFERMNLPRLSSIKLCVLLPVSEYASSELFVAELKAALSNFRYNGQKVELKVAGLSTKPEGAGALLRGFSKGVDSSGRIAAMMGGFRNFSVIVLDGGRPDLSSSKSFPTGFAWLISEIAKDTGITDRRMILENLVAGFGGGDRDAEVWSAAQANLPTYWGEIATCLSQCGRVDHAIAAGGTFDLLREGLKQRYPKWHFPDALHNEVKRLIPRRDSALAFRYIDSFAILKGM